jgi:hypothetical protein
VHELLIPYTDTKIYEGIFTDRRYIEGPARPPPPREITISTQKTTVQNNYTSSSHSSHKVAFIKIIFILILNLIFQQSAATIAVSQSTEIVNGDAGKRQIKKYGNNLNASSSPSRSRSATKELIRELM